MSSRTLTIMNGTYTQKGKYCTAAAVTVIWVMRLTPLLTSAIHRRRNREGDVL